MKKSISKLKSEENKDKVHKVLYQKYRPNSFSEVIGQEEFVNMLINSIKNNKVANSYIFSGPHGIGKTTLARIFAKAINCENAINGDACNECELCILINNNEALDIIEIDAASNNGVDNIRSIIENSSYMPSYLKYKIYIIDEAHMITTGGWNAFLKTLENPHKNVIYIFATTEIQKIPKTILSRSQIYNLFALNINQLLKLLNLVIDKEHITINEDSKLILCELANGSARDLLSIVEQLLSYDSSEIKLDTILNIFALVDNKLQFNLLLNIVRNKKILALEILNDLNDKGVSLFNLANNLLDLSIDWYIYLIQKKDNLIKPSHLQLFKNEDCDHDILARFIDELGVLIPKLKNIFSIFNSLRRFIISFNSSLNEEKIKNEEIILNSIKASDNVSNKKEEINNKEINNLKNNNSKIKDQKNSYEKSPLLNSFIINKNKLDEHFATNKDEFINKAKQKISKLNEDWRQNTLPDISSISKTIDITNKLLSKEDNNNSSLINIDLYEYYLYATYQLNPKQNSEEVKKINSLFSEVLEDENTKYFLLKEVLELIDKLVLVNKNFMIVLVANKMKAKKFNSLVSDSEILKELIKLCNNKYYIKAFTRDELKNAEKEKKEIAFDSVKYDKYIKQLDELNTDNDIVALTKKMLFKE